MEETFSMCFDSLFFTQKILSINASVSASVTGICNYTLGRNLRGKATSSTLRKH
jgi:hypothetical protein